MTKSKYIIFFITCWAAALKVWAIDFDALEKIVIQELCRVEDCNLEADCDDDLKRRIGNDLPEDANSCNAEQQYQLLARGLYLTLDGEIKNLPSEYSVTDYEGVKQQDIDPDDKVEVLTGPYIIDIEQGSPHNNREQNDKDPANKPKEEIPQVEEVTSPESSDTVAQNQRIVDSTGKPALGCTAFSTFGHRGVVGQPENSIPSLLAGLKDHHNGVEIDVQQLKDGVWVVHHDPNIGRVSYGAIGLVNNLTSTHWDNVYLKDAKGQDTDVKAPYLRDLLQAFNDHALKGQVLNIEIKAVYEKQYNCNQIAGLDQTVKGRLHGSQYMYSSSSLKVLQCMRNTNKGVYLGLVITPNPQSIELTGDARFADERALTLRFISDQKQRDLLNAYEGNRHWLKRNDFKDLAGVIGPRYGMHVDYRDYGDYIKALKRQNGRIVLYQLNDENGLKAALRKLNNNLMPDGIIVDSRKAKFCETI